MLYWNNLKDERRYIIDLLQWSDGRRAIKFREETSLPDEHTVLSTLPHSGKEIRLLGWEGIPLNGIPLADGRSFIFDAHNIWMTMEEAVFWRNNPTQNALDDAKAPWVNQLPPQFPPK